jgi:formylglycine-generating enzyme required for sulfatase activity
MAIINVFLSSTGRDLADYREAAYRAIEGLDSYHCVRMEDFGARDWAVDDFCRARVAACDLFVGIVGHLYGDCPEDDETSYTEREYEAAIAAGLPRMMFVAPDEFPLAMHLREPDEKWRKQDALRRRISKAGMRDTFDSPQDLAYRVARAIRNWEQEEAAPRGSTPSGGRRMPSGSAGPTPAELRQATQHYLAYLVDRYLYLDFKGMGVSDRVPLRLPLVEMYVPLKARIELPEGETWARQLQLAGRQVSDEEAEAMGQRLSEPMPALDLLREQDGLIMLGDPGAGKTTFLKYLATRLALGEGQSLGLGARLPVLLPLSAYANVLAAQDVPLDRFIADYYRDRGVDLPLKPMLDQALARGGALLLLDGLDEVRDLRQRHLVVERVVDFFAFHRKQGNKFILTSRVVGYREVRPAAEGLAECTLVDFEEDDIALFVDKWTAALERAARGDTAVAAQEATREREELLEAIGRNPGVRRLAANPLLLTILALMKRQGVTLPERRVELYQKYVETLLKTWNLARGLDRRSERDLDVVETTRVLAPLALWMHETSPGVGLVRREDMRRKLEEIYAGRGVSDPEQAARVLLSDARDYAGLLLERGPGEYGFIHLTFQEYLAAVAIAQRGQREVEAVVETLAAHVDDDNWHEVALLTIGYMGIVQQRDEAAGAVLWELMQAAPGEPGQATALAGQAVIDAWPGGVTLDCRAAVAGALQEALVDDKRVKAGLRAAAGDALARLDDPRPGVGVDPETGLPDIAWCHVPAAGPFWMGEGKTQHLNRHPDYDFWISRYPVTVGQFAAFVAAGGYQEPSYWPEAEAAQVWHAGRVKGRFDDTARDRPLEFGEPFNLPNHPVVGVTWYEALAFCRWLEEQFRVSSAEFRVWRNGQLETKNLRWETLTVALPSELEWERAARGEASPENRHPQRRYPWGEQADPNRANYRDTGIGATSPVGCFPGGASPYGVEELSGNVWEWTRSLYEDYPYEPADGREDLGAGLDAHRVVRGGAFDADDRFVGCAVRLTLNPCYHYRGYGFRPVASPL